MRSERRQTTYSTPKRRKMGGFPALKKNYGVTKHGDSNIKTNLKNKKNSCKELRILIILFHSIYLKTCIIFIFQPYKSHHLNFPRVLGLHFPLTIRPAASEVCKFRRNWDRDVCTST